MPARGLPQPFVAGMARSCKISGVVVRIRVGTLCFAHPMELRGADCCKAFPIPNPKSPIPAHQRDRSASWRAWR